MQESYKTMKTPVEVTVNKKKYKVDVDTRMILADMLREELRLTASRVDRNWVFWLRFLPETPGLDVTAIVDDEGNVKTQVGY